MKRTLKEYAELLNNRERDDDIFNLVTDLNKDMKEDRVVFAYGWSDDLFELDGAIYEEYDCYEDTKLVWFEKHFVDESQMDELLDYVDNEYPLLYDSIKSLLKTDNLLYIKITHPKDCQFVYETNIPCEYFNILEDGELYCKGFVFMLESLQKNN